MGRPQEVPLDEAPDVQAAPIDEEEIELPSGIGKDAASSAMVGSLPALSVGNGGSKAHSSAESMDAPVENGDHSSATEDKESSAAEAGARCEKAEVGSRRRYPESGANSCKRIGCAHRVRSQASELSSLDSADILSCNNPDNALQMEMAERKRHRMYFVREPSQAQSSDKIDVEIAALIEKATKQREQLDKLELSFNEARVCSGRLGETLQCQFTVSQRLALRYIGLFVGDRRVTSSSKGSPRRPIQSGHFLP